MNYPSEMEKLMQKKYTNDEWFCWASANGGCYCTGRCMYTREEWEQREEMKKKFEYTGVNQMKNKVGD